MLISPISGRRLLVKALNFEDYYTFYFPEVIMDDNIISLDKERDKREGPGPECRMLDALGREMFLFLLDYQFEEGSWSMELWAYSQEDAEARVTAMKKTLKYCGQAYNIIPA